MTSQTQVGKEIIFHNFVDFVVDPMGQLFIEYQSTLLFAVQYRFTHIIQFMSTQ